MISFILFLSFLLVKGNPLLSPFLSTLVLVRNIGIIRLCKLSPPTYVHIPFVLRFVIIVTFLRFLSESAGRCLSGTLDPGDSIV